MCHMEQIEGVRTSTFSNLKIRTTLRCMIVVRANGTESNPSPMSAGRDYFEYPIQVDIRGL